ncbi:MAG: hypothetical protein OXH06_15220 [Gemmatimonadetes bacterium]|nr:hypothetical protein [Gemmatimonadota bacterium]
MAKEHKDKRATPVELLAQLTPEKLAEYERVIPSSGKKVLELVEKEQAYYHEKDIFKTKKSAEVTEGWKAGAGFGCAFIFIAMCVSAANYAYWLTSIFAVLLVFVLCLIVFKK